MPQMLTAKGVIETLGNAEVKRTGTLYSVVKLRGDDGRLVTLNNVVAATNVHPEMASGYPVTLLVAKGGKFNLVYAILHDAHVSEDVAEIVRAKGKMQMFGILFVVLAVILAATIIGLLVALVPALLAASQLLGSSKLPSETQMRTEIARHVAA